MLDATRREPAGLEPIFLAAVLSRIAEVARPRLSAGGITLRLEAADDLPWLMGYPVQLELVLFNRVNNSLAAMPGGGVIGIVVLRDGNATRIEVSDTGTGIRPSSCRTLRTLDHDQAGGQGHRSRAEHRPRRDRRPRRIDWRRESAGERGHIHDNPARQAG